MNEEKESPTTLTKFLFIIDQHIKYFTILNYLTITKIEQCMMSITNQQELQDNSDQRCTYLPISKKIW